MVTTRRGNQRKQQQEGNTSKRKAPPTAVRGWSSEEYDGGNSSVSTLDDTSQEAEDQGSVATPILPLADKARATKSAGKSSSKSKEPPGSESSTRSRTLHPLRTNKQGLSLTIQKALAEAIESAGGRDTFFDTHQALYKLCEEEEDTFGSAGSKRRGQVRFKVRYWRDISLEEYHQAIRALGVVPYPDRPKGSEDYVELKKSNSKASDKKPAPKKDSNKGDQRKSNRSAKDFTTHRKQQDSSSSEDSDSSVSYTPVHKRLFSPLKKAPAIITPDPPTMSTAESVRSGRSRKSHLDDTAGAYPIPVDIDFPENNLVVDIVRFYDFDHQGKVYSGYDLTFDGDYRHFKDNRYKMSLAGNKGNMILFEKPSRASIFTAGGKDKAQYEKVETHDAVKKGHQIANESYEEEPKRHSIKFLFEFPEGTKLSNDPFREETQFGEKHFEAQVFLIRYKTGDSDKNDKALVGLSSRISFKVIDLSTGRKFKGTGNAAAKKLANQIAGLDVSDGLTSDEDIDIMSEDEEHYDEDVTEETKRIRKAAAALIAKSDLAAAQVESRRKARAKAEAEQKAQDAAARQAEAEAEAAAEREEEEQRRHEAERLAAWQAQQQQQQQLEAERLAWQAQQQQLEAERLAALQAQQQQLEAERLAALQAQQQHQQSSLLGAANTEQASGKDRSASFKPIARSKESREKAKQKIAQKKKDAAIAKARNSNNDYDRKDEAMVDDLEKDLGALYDEGHQLLQSMGESFDEEIEGGDNDSLVFED